MVYNQKLKHFRPFADLISSADYYLKYKSVKEIPYQELLNTREWFVKRIQILNRDNFFCKVCGSGEAFDEAAPGFFLIQFEQYPKVLIDIDGYKVIDYAIAGNKPHSNPLHIHHNYYIESKLPWDYPDSALITMCCDCHFEFHQKNQVPIFNKKKEKIQLTPCSRCNAAGTFPEYNHIQGGVCFRCNGSMYDEYILYKK